MSTIKVDKLQGTSGSATAITMSGANATVGGTLAVTGVHTVGNNAVATSEGGAVTMNIAQGLAKCWVQFDGTAGSISPDDSFNVASLTDNGTGNYNVNYSNNMNNADYSPSNTGNSEATIGSVGIYAGVNTRSTSTCQATYRRNNANADSEPASVQIFGDLA